MPNTNLCYQVYEDTAQKCLRHSGFATVEVSRGVYCSLIQLYLSIHPSIQAFQSAGLRLPEYGGSPVDGRVLVGGCLGEG